MTKAIRVYEHGGPEVLKWEDVSVSKPGKGEVVLETKAVGLNFIDVYQRSGLYPVELPMTLGAEGAGIVVELGPDVTNITEGQRVAYSGGQIGAYTEKRVISAEALIPLPDNIDDETAAAIMLKGLTCHMLLFKCYKVQPNDTVLIHAAAGGVGSLLCQWAKYLGATVIGTAGGASKVERAKALGCDYVIDYSVEDFAEKTKEITSNKGVPVVYDSVGKNTFEGSLDSLANFGILVTYGNASGPIEPFSPLELMNRGSLSVNRPTLFSYTSDPEVRASAARDLFDAISQGHLKIEIGQTFPLFEAAEAHRALENRETVGSTILIP